MTIKIAGAPISWGVCEVPNWGYQMDVDRVLLEMKDLNLEATEFGPEGFMPASPAGKVALLNKYGLKAVGAFVPVVAHNANHDPVPAVDKELDSFIATRAKVLILAAVTGESGYDVKNELTKSEWETLYKNIDKLVKLAKLRGITPTLHPHVGTMIENTEQVLNLLDNTSVGLCLDTGHLLIGGTDPAHLVKKYADRVLVVHAKDVNAQLAKQVQAGKLTYYDAVVKGMYVPVGKGDVDFKTIITCLSDAGFDGYYVLEQDIVLNEEPAPYSKEGAGPMQFVKESIIQLKKYEEQE
jgi:inosose dehydratase